MSHTTEQVAEIECLYQLGYTRKNRTDKLLENGLIQFYVDNRFLSARTFSRKNRQGQVVQYGKDISS
jgi:hypothetical protein